MPITRYELEPQFDSRQSFYRKAFVSIDQDAAGNPVSKLSSYDTHVASILIDSHELKYVSLFPRWDSSATTLRHVKEFLRQNGFKAETKAQIKADYHG